MSWLKRPGLGRCLWMIPLFFGIGVGIMALVRWLEGWDPVWLSDVVVTISLVTIPMGFLAGIGAGSQGDGKDGDEGDSSSHGGSTLPHSRSVPFR